MSNWMTSINFIFSDNPLTFKCHRYKWNFFQTKTSGQDFALESTFKVVIEHQ